ncbi:putative cytochrome P450 alkane hydroxylase [Myxozyma melibiosi]|uniref:Cytochrome P450 alkane hydroxylase n=1 Tax=Myxozyma melibiosi TaxID=54550 RepID=A0ABR1F895_9ASCO
MDHRIIVLLAAFVLYRILARIQQKLALAKLARERGAQPAPWFPSDVVGLSTFKALTAAAKEGTTLDLSDRWYKEHSKTFWKRTLMSDVINTCDPDNIRAMLATQFEDFEQATTGAYGILLGRGIFTANGATWSHTRSLLRPQFTRQQVVADLASSMEVHVKNFMEWVREADGMPLEMHDMFSKLTLDASTDFLFGESLDSLVKNKPDSHMDDFREQFSSAFRIAQEGLHKRVIAQGLYFLVRPKQLTDAIKTVHAFVDYYVQKSLEHNKNEKGETDDTRYVFLRELAKDTQDPIELRDNMLSVILAGRDTTASLLTWTFYLLARHPDIAAKLREEILATYGPAGDSKPVTFETLKGMVYLRGVINEALRLFPPVPLNMRRANKDTTLPRGGGPDGLSPIVLPAGTTVVYSVGAMHRRPEYFGADALEFKPERWSTGKSWTWEFLPFNGGPRICLGQQYALTEAGYVIVRLLQEYDTVENADSVEKDARNGGMPYRHMAMTMWNNSGVNVIFKNSK